MRVEGDYLTVTKGIVVISLIIRQAVFNSCFSVISGSYGLRIEDRFFIRPTIVRG